jgi:hypothetical protein
MVGAAATCWAIWRFRNDIFYNCMYSSFMQFEISGDMLDAPLGTVVTCSRE